MEGGGLSHGAAAAEAIAASSPKCLLGFPIEKAGDHTKVGNEPVHFLMPLFAGWLP